MVIDWIKNTNRYVIYGAQVIAAGAYEALTKLTGIKPECFAVGKSMEKPTYPTGNPRKIDGILVRPIEEISKETYIVVAVTELIQKEVLPYLSECGYENVYALTQHEEHLLMSKYYQMEGIFPLAVQAKEEGREDGLVLYEVRNDRDKPVENHPKLFDYERAIQAGAAISETIITPVTDHTGINISRKNRMYCEMTAVYWIWKNTEHDWVGIEHYRRHLLVNPGMLGDQVDAVMPLPYICYPHEMTQFLRFTTKEVLDALLRALREIHPDQYDGYLEILYGKYQYTYNLLCARRHVFDDYCRWFFEITEYMEKRMSKEVPALLETRAFSYVAEVLTNLYFMYHQKNLRILHVEKAIYT